MKRIILVFLILPFFTVNAYAEEIFDETAEVTGIHVLQEILEEDELKISGELRTDGTYDVNGALERLWSRVLALAAEYLEAELGYGLELAAIAVLCSLATALSADGKIQPYINLISCAAAAMLVAGRFDGIINQATTALEELSAYSKAAIPALCTAAAAGGAVVSAAAKYAAVCMAVEIIMTAAQKFIIPMIYTYLALCISRSLFDNPLLSAFAKAAKWTATTLMTMITLCFSTYISVTGVIAGSTDAVAVKTAKTIISSSLPVVGGIISDASAVVLSAASVIKSTAGAFALISVCAMCAGPFVSLSVKMLVFRAASAAADMLQGGRLSSFINDMGNVFSMLLGLVGCSGIMLFISIMSLIKAVNF